MDDLHPKVAKALAEGKISAGDARWMSDYAHTTGDSRGSGDGTHSEKMQNYINKIKQNEVHNPWPDDRMAGLKGKGKTSGGGSGGAGVSDTREMQLGADLDPKEMMKRSGYKRGGKVTTAGKNPKHKNCW